MASCGRKAIPDTRRRGRLLCRIDQRGPSMNLARLAAERAERNGPIGVALIGAGKFGSMFLTQAPTMPGIAVRAIADLYPERVPEKLAGLGWSAEAIAAVRLT